MFGTTKTSSSLPIPQKFKPAIIICMFQAAAKGKLASGDALQYTGSWQLQPEPASGKSGCAATPNCMCMQGKLTQLHSMHSMIEPLADQVTFAEGFD